MSEIEVGSVISITENDYSIKKILSSSRDAVGNYEVVDAQGERFLIWRGSLAWSRDVLAVLEDIEHPCLPRLIATDDAEDDVFFLLEAPPTTAAPFEDATWRAASRTSCVISLQSLAMGVVQLHERKGWLQGIKRRDLYLDLVSNRLHIIGMPRFHVNRRPAIEAPWRDMRLIGELCYEGFVEKDYPGGHHMAGILQDKDRLAGTQLQFPGFPQVLAGCVSPYGDLAYKDPYELREGLDQIRVELARPINFIVGATSTVGNYLFRKNNQDSCGHISFQSVCGSQKVNLGFFCVADGIGGIQDGENASRLAVETACQSFARGWAHYGAPSIIESPREFAHAVAKVVGQRLALEGEFAPGTNRGGTTFSGIVIAGRRAGICHVGDSRITLIRSGECIQLTDDHTLATILVRLGELTPEEALENDLSQRTISRFLSTSAEVENSKIDGTGRDLEFEGNGPHGFDIKRGDLFVLTSDGSHGEFTEELLLVLAKEFDGDPQSLCDALVQNALDRMGRDNSTALAVLVE